VQTRSHRARGEHRTNKKRPLEDPSEPPSPKKFRVNEENILECHATKKRKRESSDENEILIDERPAVKRFRDDVSPLLGPFRISLGPELPQERERVDVTYKEINQLLKELHMDRLTRGHHLLVPERITSAKWDPTSIGLKLS